VTVEQDAAFQAELDRGAEAATKTAQTLESQDGVAEEKTPPKKAPAKKAAGKATDKKAEEEDED
jgi:hypothetical protein